MPDDATKRQPGPRATTGARDESPRSTEVGGANGDDDLPFGTTKTAVVVVLVKADVPGSPVDVQHLA